MSKKVLLVDDDSNLLQGLRRQLRKTYALETAESGPQALDLCRAKGPFAVVVSDMQMPGMNGVEFLAALGDLSAETVRIMLTGNADQKTAVQAVNSGQIFRFLNKPCTREELESAINAGIKHYQLITAEKELVSKTLTGSIKVLMDVLSLSNPTAFSRSSRLRRVVHQLLDKVEVESRWECEIAAMLSQIGFVTLTNETIKKLAAGSVLSPEEQESVKRHPKVASELIAHIPRLSGVAKIVEHQAEKFDASQPDSLPIGSRLLKLATDFDTLCANRLDRLHAVAELETCQGWYDPTLVAALREIVQAEIHYTVKEITFNELKEGDVLAGPVQDGKGTVLVSKGQEVSGSLLAKLKQFSNKQQLREPIEVMVAVTKEESEEELACV